MWRSVWSVTLLLLLTVPGTAGAAPVSVRLDAHNQRSAAGVLSTLKWKACTPVSATNPCLSTSTASTGGIWSNANATPSTAVWTWDAATGILSMTGIFQTTSFISSNANGSPVVSDRVVDLVIDTVNDTATAASYRCVEGTFIATVGSNGCMNISLGGDFTNNSSALYDVGGNAGCVQRTVGGDDTILGNTRGLMTVAAAPPCDPQDGAFDLWVVELDNTASGGQLIIRNGIPITNASTNFLTFTAAPDAVDDTATGVQGAPISIDVLANDSGFANPVTVTATVPANGTAIVNGSPGDQGGIDVTYTPDAGFSGTDTFTYTVVDANAATDTATVTVTVTGTGSGVVLLQLDAHNQISSGGALSTLKWKTCSPTGATNPCISTTNAWTLANVTGSTAVWTWDAATGVLSMTGTFQSTSFVSSNANGSPVISDKVVDLVIDTVNNTTSAASYNCIEGTFLASVGANGCLNTSLGDDFANSSSALYNVGGDPYCVQRTIGGDDASTGNTRGLATLTTPPCDPMDGAFNHWVVEKDETATGGQLIVRTDTAITLPGANYLTFSVAPDSAPDPFTFGTQSGVPVSTLVTSGAVTISGLAGPAPVSVAGGEYSVGCGAAYTGSAGTIDNSQMVCVRHTSAATPATSTVTTLTIGGVSGTFTSTTQSLDTVPNPFSFTDQTGVALASTVTSAPVTITGITGAAPVSVTGGLYSIDGGAFTSTAGTVADGSQVRVRHTSSAAPGTAVDTVLNVGGVTDTFTSTTVQFAIDDTATTAMDQSVEIDVLQNDIGLLPSVYVGIWTDPLHGRATVSGAPGSPAGIRIIYTPDPGYVGPDSFEHWVENGVEVDFAVVTVTVTNGDTDGDGIFDDLDNCTQVPNPGQCDSDGDGYGNHCDGDLTGNGVTNSQDTVVFRGQLGRASNAPAYNAADFNCSGSVNAQDTALFRQLLGKPPGPSGLAP